MIQEYRVAVWRHPNFTMIARVLADGEARPGGAQLYSVRAHYPAEAEARAGELALMRWEIRAQESRDE